MRKATLASIDSIYSLELVTKGYFLIVFLPSQNQRH